MSNEMSNEKTNEMSKGKIVLLLFSAFLVNFAVMGDYLLMPIYNTLYEEFSANVGAVNTLISAQPILIVIFSIVAAILLRKVSKKNLLVTGGILFAIGGIFGASVENIWFMLAMRIPYGIGTAFLNVSAVSLIAELYSDQKRRGSVMGFFNAFMTATGAILSIVGGYLATIYWKDVYLVYWFAIPMIVMFIIFIPNIKPSNMNIENNDDNIVSNKKETLGFMFWMLVIGFALLTLAFSIPSLFISTYVIENSLGTEAFAGTLNSVGTLSGFIFCLAFGTIYSKLRKNIIVPIFILEAASLLLMAVYPSKTIAIIAMILAGGAFASGFSFAYAHSPGLVPINRINDAIGIITAAYGIGFGLGTYFATFVMGILGSFEITPVLIVSSVLCIIALLIQIIGGNNNKNKLKNHEAI